jgi:hypothetical protein
MTITLTSEAPKRKASRPVVITAILVCGLLAVFLLCGTSAASVAIAVRLLVLDTACHG